MIRIRVLPFICAAYPEANGWLDREFTSDCAFTAWLAVNADDIELIWFEGDSCWVDFREFMGL